MISHKKFLVRDEVRDVKLMFDQVGWLTPEVLKLLFRPQTEKHDGVRCRAEGDVGHLSKTNARRLAKTSQ